MKQRGHRTNPADTKVFYRDFWGPAAAKRRGLIASLPSGKPARGSVIHSYEPVTPSQENRWRLAPRTIEAGFEAWPGLDELFPISFQGVNHNRGLERGKRNAANNEWLITVPEPRKVSESLPVYADELVNLHVHERGSVVFPRETRGDDLLSDRDANIPEATWRILQDHFGLEGARRDERHDPLLVTSSETRSPFSTHPVIRPNTRVRFRQIGLTFPYRRMQRCLNVL
jgi:hypothetical protein